MSISNKDKLIDSINSIIFNDYRVKEKSINDITRRIEDIFNNKNYLDRLITSDRNWLDLPTKEVLNRILLFLKSL